MPSAAAYPTNVLYSDRLRWSASVGTTMIPVRTSASKERALWRLAWRIARHSQGDQWHDGGEHHGEKPFSIS